VFCDSTDCSQRTCEAVPSEHTGKPPLFAVIVYDVEALIEMPVVIRQGSKVVSLFGTCREGLSYISCGDGVYRGTKGYEATWVQGYTDAWKLLHLIQQLHAFP
jgi:hypothetical protein